MVERFGERADMTERVELALRLDVHRSNKEIARELGCGDTLVRKVRAELLAEEKIPDIPPHPPAIATTCSLTPRSRTSPVCSTR
jgi:hypothetical protein